MREFKFFNNTKENYRDPIEFLFEYHRRLDYHYIHHHRIYTAGHQYNRESYELFNRTRRFIQMGQLTSKSEVGRYLYLSYRSITGEDYQISYVNECSITDDTYNYLNSRRAPADNNN